LRTKRAAPNEADVAQSSATLAWTAEESQVVAIQSKGKTEDAPARCSWARTSLSIAYHDLEWGVPVHDDNTLFEFLTLEGAQAGLSWETILKKREAYRQAFAGFDPRLVARFRAAQVVRLLGNPGIVRNRLKIGSTVSNAKAFLAVQREFVSFDAYVWTFVGGTPRINRRRTPRQVPTDTAVGRPEPGPLEPRVQVRGIDDLLRLHASSGHGERSHDELFPI
jgi:DNA-3-methyladenine glycosylase I